MHKIDRIRRKLEDNKRKSIYQEIRINPNISFLSQTPKTLPPHAHLPTTLSVFPVISKPHAHEVSTNHSERSLTFEPFQAEPAFSGRRTHGSIFVERSKMRSRKQRLAENVEQLATRTLNPSSRANWACQKDALTTPLKQTGNCIINTQTPSTVIILTEPVTPSGRGNRTLFRRTLPKRQSVVVRHTYSPPQKGESPTRKFSISAWETFDEE